jgi:hypothetical protein
MPILLVFAVLTHSKAKAMTTQEKEKNRDLISGGWYRTGI